MAYTDIDKPTDYFNTKLYTGNATNPTTISGIGFQPDWVWTKLRSGGTEAHRLCDAVRGVTKDLFSDATDGEATNTIGLKSFNSDGYVIGNSNGYNLNSGTFVSWNWLASNTTASNTQGDITSTVSANTTSGFSIVSYTGNGTAGATVGHGLSSQLDVIFIKNRTNAEAWQTYHRPLGATHHLSLNTTSSAQDNDTRFNDTHPTSSVFTLGNNDTVNKNTSNFVAYCFHSVKGFSKFGSYTGNGNADGTFVYTGMKLSFVMVKRTNTTGSWMMYDNKRATFNVNNKLLFADTNDSESTTGSGVVDFLSNGFKWRGTATGTNGSGDSYIYMCFAENPFVTSTGIPTTAR